MKTTTADDIRQQAKRLCDDIEAWQLSKDCNTLARSIRPALRELRQLAREYRLLGGFKPFPRPPVA
jgi:hypothetical protein